MQKRLRREIRRIFEIAYHAVDMVKDALLITSEENLKRGEGRCRSLVLGCWVSAIHSSCPLPKPACAEAKEATSFSLFISAISPVRSHGSGG